MLADELARIDKYCCYYTMVIIIIVEMRCVHANIEYEFIMHVLIINMPHRSFDTKFGILSNNMAIIIVGIIGINKHICISSLILYS